tara:strand:+ start:3153 stop:3611 length:459 start_codon:yes stop_codon:yes gene_type:complete
MILKNAVYKWQHSEGYLKQSGIHWFVWLLENPNSPISLTGAVDLENHDLVHILLDRGMTILDEAMVIGFTMGNSTDTSSCIKWLFEFCAKYIYPKGYKFNDAEIVEFNRGYAYGYTRPKRNIHLASFNFIENVSDIRKKWGINIINTKEIEV